MDLKNVGKNIQRVRNEMGFTQAELAEIAGFSVNHISRIETGNGTMSLDSLVAIANALNTTPDYLLLGEYNITPNRAALVISEKFKDLTQDEIAYVFKAVDLLRDLKVNRT